MPRSIKETPAKRALTLNLTSPADVPDWMKARVIEKSPRGHRCLIEGFSAEKSINVCHLYPRHMSKAEEEMKGLEYHWDMQFGTLNLNSSANLFLAGAGSHWMFDEGKYTLVPQIEILDLLVDPENPVGRGNFEETMRKVLKFAKYSPKDIEKKTPIFAYTLVPLMRSMEDVILVYEHLGIPGQQEVTIHRYPYDNFPKIESHIQPHFVLISLGLMLCGESAAVLEAMEGHLRANEVHVPFQDVVELYNRWIKAPSDWRKDTTFCNAGKPYRKSGGDTNDKTYQGTSGSVASSRRTVLYRECQGPNKRANEGPASPTPSGSRKGNGDSERGSKASKKPKLG